MVSIPLLEPDIARDDKLAAFRLVPEKQRFEAWTPVDGCKRERCIERESPPSGMMRH